MREGKLQMMMQLRSREKSWRGQAEHAVRVCAKGRMAKNGWNTDSKERTGLERQGWERAGVLHRIQHQLLLPSRWAATQSGL